MDKLEKVIKGLECCMSEEDKCLVCPYYGVCYVTQKFQFWAIFADALALLKAQEPVEPVFERKFMSDIEIYDCGKCGTSLGAKGIAKYCMKCGKSVKWE